MARHRDPLGQRHRRRARRPGREHRERAGVLARASSHSSSGFVGTSDGWTDLSADKQLNFDYDSAPNGNVLQTGEIAVNGTTSFTLALGFGSSTGAAETAARAQPRPTGSPRTSAAYQDGWHGYLSGLSDPRRGADRRAADAVRRVGDDDQGARGQDLSGRVHRVADAALGLCRQRRQRRRRLPLRVGARRVPAGLLAAGRRRPRRRRSRGDVAVHAPAAGRRHLPAELARRRHARSDQHPARRDRLPAHPRLAAAARTDDADLAGHPQGGRGARGARTGDPAGTLGGDRRLLALDDRGGDRRARRGLRPRPPARRHRARGAVARRRRPVAAQHRAVDVHDQRPATATAATTSASTTTATPTTARSATGATPPACTRRTPSSTPASSTWCGSA